MKRMLILLQMALVVLVGISCGYAVVEVMNRLLWLLGWPLELRAAVVAGVLYSPPVEF